MANFDYYKIFFYAATSNSFSRAAQILDTTQPNVTRCMNNLEAQLGTRLFARSRNGISLTPEGRQLYDDISKAIPLLESAEAQFLHNNPLDSGLITISITDISMHLVVLPIMRSFHNKQPNVRFKIISSTSLEALHSIENAKVDFSILTTPVTIPHGIKTEKLLSFQESFYTAFSKSPYISDTHSLRQISQAPLISMGTGSSTRQFIQNIYQKEKVDLRIDFEATSMEQVLHMIQNGVGIGMYPDCLIENQHEHPLYKIPVSFQIPKRDILLLTNPKKSLSFASQLFIDEIKSNSSSME